MIYVWFALMLLAAAYAASGLMGLLGMSYGLLAGAFGAGALAAIVWLVGKNAAKQAPPRRGVVMIVLAAFVKFPLIAAVWSLAHREGRAAEASFAAGIVLVYSALVGWAATRPDANP